MIINFINKIKQIISNSSIKTNLLRLYITIIVVMSFLLMTILLYSIDLNSNYNQFVSNLKNYNSVYNNINSVDKDIYLNITEQKPFDQKSYDKMIKVINNSLNKIKINNDNDDDFDDENEISMSVEVLKRAVGTINKYINETNLLIKNNSDYPQRENKLILITQAKNLIKDNIQELIALELAHSQKYIDTTKNRYNAALGIIMILFILSILASIVLLLLVIKGIVKKINIISDKANKLANGDLSIEEISFDTSDEFEILAKSFNKMKANINDYIAQISSNEIKISTILNEMNDCVITTNSKGEIESCNNSIEKMFNYTKEEILGHNINEIISSIDFSTYTSNDSNAKNLIKNVKIIDNKYQLNGMKKENVIFPIELSYKEVEFEGHIAINFVIHDITQHKEIERMKNEFVSTVSHELRTPLTSIRGALGLVTGGLTGELTIKAKELLTIADSNSLRLINLINDILDIEKIEAGKMDFDMEVIELLPLIENTIQVNTQYADKFNVNIELENPIEGIKINVDRSRFIQVLTNLLSNAIKFAYKNSTVKISTFFVEEKIRVSVTNYGLSISKEFHNLIFQKFTQGDSSNTRKKGGTGLGLSISKAIIENMNGSINFISENDCTTFYFDLPKIL